MILIYFFSFFSRLGFPPQREQDLLLIDQSQFIPQIMLFLPIDDLLDKCVTSLVLHCVRDISWKGGGGSSLTYSRGEYPPPIKRKASYLKQVFPHNFLRLRFPFLITLRTLGQEFSAVYDTRMIYNASFLPTVNIEEQDTTKL